MEPVYLPSNEPYLGRESVFQFDNVIISCLELSGKVAKYTHQRNLSQLQLAASEIVPQAISIALSIRELVRQGYLFGALVLIRPLVERAGILHYLYEHPDALEIWADGWKYGRRPSLEKMLKGLNPDSDQSASKEYKELFNAIVHGDPRSTGFNLVKLEDGKQGFSVSKMTDNPDLCDFVSFQSVCWLVVVMSITAGCFPRFEGT